MSGVNDSIVSTVSSKLPINWEKSEDVKFKHKWGYGDMFSP